MCRSALFLLLGLSLPVVMPQRAGAGTEAGAYADLAKIHVKPESLPKPLATGSAVNGPTLIRKPSGALLKVPKGFEVTEAATGFDMPRMMVLAPNGDVFLSEPGANRVTVLRDRDDDGKFEGRWTFAEALDLPFGMAFVDEYLYVANTGNVVRFPYRAGQTKAAAKPEIVVPRLPRRGYNQHWTRNLLYDAKVKKLYITVGSQTNCSEEEPHRAAILRCDPDGKNLEVFASGLRNPVGLAQEPVTGAIWTAVNERDGLGDDLVPDYATHLEPNGFYGWPYSYIGRNPQPGLGNKRPDLVARAIVPDVLFQAHSAALGMVFYTGNAFPGHFRGGAFVAFHGSWNRSKPTGYKIVFLPFEKGHALGYYEDFLTGWQVAPDSSRVWGRPVGLLVDKDGSLLITDDGANKIWRVRYKGDR